MAVPILDLDLLRMKSSSIKTHIVISPISRRTSTWRRWRRRRFIPWRRRRSSSRRTLLLLLRLLIILIIRHIVRISTPRRIRISARLTGIVLGVLGCIVCRARRSRWARRSSCGWSGWRLGAAVGTVWVLGAVALLAIVLTVAPVVTLGRVFFEPFVLLFYVSKEVFAEFACALDFLGVGPAERFRECSWGVEKRYSRDMKVHRLITFSTSTLFHKTRVSSFDLDTATCFLLDVLYIRSSMTHDLCPKIEAWNWLKINWDALLGPFTLRTFSCNDTKQYCKSYSTEFITLDLFRFSSTKASLVD